MQCKLSVLAVDGRNETDYVGSFGGIDYVRRLQTGLFKYMAGLDIRDTSSKC